MSVFDDISNLTFEQRNRYNNIMVEGFHNMIKSGETYVIEDRATDYILNGIGDVKSCFVDRKHGG